MKTVYVFVRQDIPLAQQLVQSNHAVFEMSQHFWHLDAETPNIVVVGVPHSKALDRVWQKLETNHIPSLSWREPDMDLGFTAIATQPLGETDKLPLANYRLWRHTPTESPDLKGTDAKATLAGGSGAN